MKKYYYLISIFFFSVCFQTVHSQTAAELYNLAIVKEQNANEEEALTLCLKSINLDPVNYDVLCKTSLLYSKVGNRITDTEQKKVYFNSAKKYAGFCLKLKPNDAESNYVMAVAMGRMALISGSKEKVAAVRDIKIYIDLALKFNPNHAGALYTLGKWNYEVANLNFAEVAIANSLFGGIPDGASIDKAIECFNKAISITPDYILFYYDLALSYDDKGNSSLAISTLNKVLILKSSTEDDPTTINKCKLLLKDLQ
jgi:tetratricopeptide (TPR) repeat protein